MQKDSTMKSNDNFEYALRFLYVFLGSLSIIGLSFVALSIFYNEKLQDHPSPLIARICIVEAMVHWCSLMKIIEPKMLVCYFNLYDLLFNWSF